MTRRAKYTTIFIITLVASIIVLNVVAQVLLRDTFSETCPLIIMNESGQPLRQVKVSITWDDPRISIEHWQSTLQSGERIEIATGSHDWAVDIVYTLNDKEFQHHDPHIDLWNGEAWQITVDSNGQVSAGYDR